ncbi:velvet factor, partial [Chytridium lagenaria]
MLDTLPSDGSPITYRLVVRQHPDRARMIGFGDKDRSPTYRGDSKEFKGRVINDESERLAGYPHLVLHASIINIKNEEETSNVREDDVRSAATSTAVPPRNVPLSSPTPPTEASIDLPLPMPAPKTAPKHHVLVGQIVVACTPFPNFEGRLEMLFLFTDLSVRLAGKFKLKFQLFDVSTRPSGQALATVESQVFTSYHPKEFPGMSPWLSRQGARIHIRTDVARQIEVYSSVIGSNVNVGVDGVMVGLRERGGK